MQILMILNETDCFSEILESKFVPVKNCRTHRVHMYVNHSIVQAKSIIFIDHGRLCCHEVCSWVHGYKLITHIFHHFIKTVVLVIVLVYIFWISTHLIYLSFNTCCKRINFHSSVITYCSSLMQCFKRKFTIMGLLTHIKQYYTYIFQKKKELYFYTIKISCYFHFAR